MSDEPEAIPTMEEMRSLVANFEMLTMNVRRLGATELGDAERMLLAAIATLHAAALEHDHAVRHAQKVNSEMAKVEELFDLLPGTEELEDFIPAIKALQLAALQGREDTELLDFILREKLNISRWEGSEPKMFSSPRDAIRAARGIVNTRSGLRAPTGGENA